MSPSLAVFTFLNVWWVMLFFVLPFWVKPDGNRSAVDYVAAPQPPRWRKLLLINTLASLLVTALLALIINSGVISIRDIS